MQTHQDRVNLVIELRDKTSYGMYRCKKALEQNDWDTDKAIEYLDKQPNEWI